jgi:predicted RNA-binding Zn-ribbon protein involved in translation (DUF1610 family)
VPRPASKKNATFDLIRCLADHRAALLQSVCVSALFAKPPAVEFRPEQTHCPDCGAKLTVRKTRTRTVSTLHVGPFRAREVFLLCNSCGHTQRSKALGALVPPGANFGYDVMVYAGKALFLRHRNEAEVVAELAQSNIQISPREVSLLGMKFIVYLALAHQRRAPEIHADMQTRGGYICHLDATCEGRDPFLMSSIDSLSNIVLGNVKLPAEDEAHIVPFLERLKQAFGVPLALVHDMGKGILAAVATVFPGVADFICHFHFLRDIGKDFLGTEYDTIRTRLSRHGISATLRYRAKQLKRDMDANPAMSNALQCGMEKVTLPAEAFAFAPVVGAYTLIQWALSAKAEGDGYGFPFDHPHLAFAQRLQRLNAHVERIKDIHLRGLWRDNAPYFKIHIALKPILKDKALWKTVAAIEAKTIVFEKLRKAMRIALPAGPHGLNDTGDHGNIRTIEKRVKTFRAWLTRCKDYPQNRAARKMIEQIDKYWEKLFADPITVQTTAGPVLIQPQRTNNILEQFFRSLKRVSRRRTGNASSGRMLRTILAETPLVRNLENPHYMHILLNGKPSIETLFAEIEIDTLRQAFREAQDDPEKIPAKLKPLIAMPNFPEKLVTMVEKAVA